MDRPSSTITAAAIGGTVAGFVMIILAVAAPDIYQKLRVYPGAEAHIATAAAFVAGWIKREKVKRWNGGKSGGVTQARR